MFCMYAYLKKITKEPREMARTFELYTGRLKVKKNTFAKSRNTFGVCVQNLNFCQPTLLMVNKNIAKTSSHSVH